MEAVVGVFILFMIIFLVIGMFSPKLVFFWALQENQKRVIVFLYSITGILVMLTAYAALTEKSILTCLVGLLAIFCFYKFNTSLTKMNMFKPIKKQVNKEDSCPYNDETKHLCVFKYRCECFYNEIASCPIAKEDFPCPEGIVKEIRSCTDYNKKYTVDTRTLSCTCPDWCECRYTFDYFDPQRLCKHLICEIFTQNLIEKYFADYYPEIIKLFSSQKGFPCNNKKSKLDYSNINTDDDEITLKVGWVDQRGDNWIEDWIDRLQEFYNKKITQSEDIHLRSLFGGDKQCLYNFTMYAARMDRNEKLCYIPIDNRYRKRFDILVLNGVALKNNFLVTDVLYLLSMEQLRELADTLQVKRSQNKKQLIKNFETCDLAILDNILFPQYFDKDDFFTLLPVDISKI